MSEGGSSRFGRLAKALGAYAAVVLLVWWVVEPIRRVILLPEMFVVGTRVALILAAPLVVAVAWRYPELGRDAEPRDPAETDQAEGSPRDTPQ